ncbi:MAG: hypothetical protein J6S60_09770 [Oscillospiraceae bacterium]|nr:hypothetical protein [Oscillospiraceae bacterium]
MKYLDYAGVQRLWAAIGALVAARVAAALDGFTITLVSDDPNLIIEEDTGGGQQNGG